MCAAWLGLQAALAGSKGNAWADQLWFFGQHHVPAWRAICGSCVPTHVCLTCLPALPMMRRASCCQTPLQCHLPWLSSRWLSRWVGSRHGCILHGWHAPVPMQPSPSPAHAADSCGCSPASLYCLWPHARLQTRVPPTFLPSLSPHLLCVLQTLHSFPLPDYTGSAEGAGIVEDPLFGRALSCSSTDRDLVGGATVRLKRGVLAVASGWLGDGRTLLGTHVETQRSRAGLLVRLNRSTACPNHPIMVQPIPN